jgi:hypothetical protein
MKQRATNATRPVVDFRFGFPGKMPHHGRRQGVVDKRLPAFLEAVASGTNAKEAARLAGYGKEWARAHATETLKRYDDYVKWLQAHYAQARIKRHVIEQEPVLQLMAEIAYANDDDYIVRENGTARRKAVHELTRNQLAAVTVVTRRGRKLDWEFRDRDAAMANLGKYLGLFNEKIVLERRHIHLIGFSESLRNVPQAELDALEGEFEAILQKRWPKKLEHKK